VDIPEEQMDVRFMNPFVAATQTVLRTVLEIEASIGKPTLKAARNTWGEVTSIMSVAGDRQGTIAVSFGEEGALLVFNRLMRDEATSLCPEVAEAIGEVTNMIARRARKEFEKNGVSIETSPPTVVMGKGVRTNSVTDLPTIFLPFSFPVENDSREAIYLEFAFK
jgi:chemotaxis protein CheX